MSISLAEWEMLSVFGSRVRVKSIGVDLDHGLFVPVYSPTGSADNNPGNTEATYALYVDRRQSLPCCKITSINANGEHSMPASLASCTFRPYGFDSSPIYQNASTVTATDLLHWDLLQDVHQVEIRKVSGPAFKHRSNVHGPWFLPRSSTVENIAGTQAIYQVSHDGCHHYGRSGRVQPKQDWKLDSHLCASNYGTTGQYDELSAKEDWDQQPNTSSDADTKREYRYFGTSLTEGTQWTQTLPKVLAMLFPNVAGSTKACARFIATYTCTVEVERSPMKRWPPQYVMKQRKDVEGLKDVHQVWAGCNSTRLGGQPNTHTS